MVPVSCPHDPWHGCGIEGRVAWITNGQEEDCKEEDIAGSSADEAAAEGWTRPGRLLPDKNGSDCGTVAVGGIVRDSSFIVGPKGRKVGNGARVINGPGFGYWNGQHEEK